MIVFQQQNNFNKALRREILLKDGIKEANPPSLISIEYIREGNTYWAITQSSAPRITCHLSRL